MRLRDLGRSLHDEKKILRNGCILLTFGAVLTLLILKFDLVWGALSTVFNTAAPVFFGIVIAYILNVFVHFFEDIAFRPFRSCRSKAWNKLRRPLSVSLAYLVVVLVLLFISLFIIPGLIESMSTIAETAQKTVPGYVNSAVAWLNEFAQKNDLAFLEDFVKSFNWTSLFSNATKMTADFLGSLLNVTFNVASGVFTAVMGFIFSVYMLFGKEKLLRGLKSTLLAFLPEQTARKLNRRAPLPTAFSSPSFGGSLPNA